MKIGIYYFRSLYSQSACSLSVGKFSDFLLNRGYNVKIGMLKLDDYVYNKEQIDNILENDVVIYKTNYKDFEYGIRFFQNIKEIYKDKKIYVTGPFANLNSERIKRRYTFIEDIINIQDATEIENRFLKIGNAIDKHSLVYGIDREMECLENGAYINLEASTGCIYNCVFCHINILKYPKNIMDVESLINEIDYLVNKMGKRYLIFNDSVFWKNDTDTSRIQQIIEKIKKRNIKFYFMIYLSLTSKIPLELLKDLKEIGLIRVFFGVENISKEFQMVNHKYVSAEDTKEFIKILTENNITYHIGFILFSYTTTYNEIFFNLKFLKEIKKLFRPGIITEKMRILPNSENSKLLYESETKVDQSYNYVIKDENAEKCYKLIFDFFANINIRYFEYFFSSIDIAIAALKNEKKDDMFENEIELYNGILEEINQKIYDVLNNICLKLKYTDEDIVQLLDLYSRAEMMYILFSNKLSKDASDILKMLPHGKEELNV